MQVILLYAILVLIWGTTWAAISFQLGAVPVEVSVAYRFAIASLALFAWALLTKRRIVIPRRHYPMIVLQGVLLFSVHYYLVYYGTAYITTGLVAVVFSSLVLINAVNERIFFGTPIDRSIVIAATLGLLGIGLIFWPEMAQLNFRGDTLKGFGFLLLSVFIASLGNMTAFANTGKNLPVVAVNAHGMMWGSILSATIALMLGREFVFSTEPAYVWSLLYLAIPGSAIAFGCYLALLHRIGSARTAYSSVLFPVVALTVSTFIENYHWSIMSASGVILTLAGNYLALARTHKIVKTEELE